MDDMTRRLPLPASWAYAEALAAEQVRDWRRIGWGPIQCLRALGAPVPLVCGWDDVHAALTRAAMAMGRPEPARAA